MHLQPYVFFDGLCEEAIEFYRGAIGAEVVMLMRYKDNPEPQARANLPPGSENKVMHATLRIGDAMMNVSDGRCEGPPTFEGFSLSLTVPDEGQADRAFNGLSAGGQITMPLGKTFFSPRFGMLTDRFGVAWIIYVASR